jgi:hypothetical protein
MTKRLPQLGALTAASRQLAELRDLPNALAPLVAARGRLGTLSLLGRLARDKVLAPPFGHLPPPADAREREARRIAEVPVLLYRHLAHTMTQAEALDLTWLIIERGAWRSLAALLDGLDLEAYSRLDLRARIVFIQELLARFPNLTADIDFAEPDRVGFTVTACAFARLTREAGHPELAPLFCRIDALYFKSRGFAFERQTTLASGGPGCPFRLSLPTP